jgi:hypothetical protein
VNTKNYNLSYLNHFDGVMLMLITQFAPEMLNEFFDANVTLCSDDSN